jgi:hypothetical protein
VTLLIDDRSAHSQIDGQSEEDLANDLLIGAEAIARELNWKTPQGRWNRRRVYHLAEQGQLPIHHLKGLGLCARRSALRAFFEQLDEPFMDSTASNR